MKNKQTTIDKRWATDNFDSSTYVPPKQTIAKIDKEDKPTTTKAVTPQSLARSLVASRIDEAKRLAETVIKPSEAKRTKHFVGTAHDVHQEVHGGKGSNAQVPDGLSEIVYASVDDSGLIDTLIPNSHKMNAAQFIYKAYEYKDKVTGLKTEVLDVELDRYGEKLSIKGTIQDRDGSQVGIFERTINSDGSVDQDLFTLDSDKQANGFGKRYYQNQEDTYIEAGFSKVNIHANKDVGGYAWARMGYDFNKNAEGSADNKSWDEDNEEWILYDGYEAHSQTVDKFTNLYTQTYGTPPPFIPEHAWEFAAYRGPDGRTIGKEAMLGSNWFATKSLALDSLGYKIGQDYYGSK